MSDAEQVRRSGGGSDQDQDAPAEESTAAADAKELLDDVDELLDEIDDILEENAEEFVRGYVQKGGE